MTNHYKYHVMWKSVGLLLVTFVIYLSLTSQPPEIMTFSGADKVGHLLAYATLMGWFGQLYTTTRQLTFFAIGFIVMGITLEYIQGMTGYRMFDYADMAANTFGVFIGLWLTRRWFAGFLLGVERILGVIHQ